MASVDECRVALTVLADRLAAADPDARARRTQDRTLSLHISDLSASFSGRIAGGTLCDIRDGEGERAQIRLRCSSDDFVALTSGVLGAAGAWATGRLRIEASPLDLLRLRSLL